MKSSTLLAVLVTEKAALQSQLATLEHFDPKHELVEALQTRLKEHDFAIEKVSSQVRATETVSETDLDTKIMNHQMVLENIIMHNLSIGRKDTKVIHEFVFNMMKLRKNNPISVEEVKAFFEPRGYTLKNWGDFFYQMKKRYPQVERVSLGKYAVPVSSVESINNIVSK